MIRNIHHTIPWPFSGTLVLNNICNMSYEPIDDMAVKWISLKTTKVALLKNIWSVLRLSDSHSQ